MTSRSSGVSSVALPEFDVLVHRHFGRHPVVGAAVEVVLPRPVVLERHELVDVDGGQLMRRFSRLPLGGRWGHWVSFGRRSDVDSGRGD